MISNNAAITTPIPVLELCAHKDGRDGVLYELEFARGVKLTEKNVRQVAKDRLDELIKRKAGSELGLWESHLLTSLKLLSAFRNEDEDYFRRLIEEELIEDPTLRQQALAQPQAWLASCFASGLEGASFVVWWDERQEALSPGILCKKRRATLYVLAATLLRQPNGIGICLRCNTPFKRKRTQQSWCSSRCRSAEAMARWREGNKESNTAKDVDRKKMRGQRNIAK